MIAPLFVREGIDISVGFVARVDVTSASLMASIAQFCTDNGYLGIPCVNLKRAEIAEYHHHVSDWELRRYAQDLQVAILKRVTTNVIEEIRLEIPLHKVTQIVGIGGDLRLEDDAGKLPDPKLVAVLEQALRTGQPARNRPREPRHRPSSRHNRPRQHRPKPGSRRCR